MITWSYLLPVLGATLIVALLLLFYVLDAVEIVWQDLQDKMQEKLIELFEKHDGSG